MPTKLAHIKRALLILLIFIISFCSNTLLARTTRTSLINKNNPSLVKMDKKAIYRFGIAIGQIKQLYVNEVADKKLFSNAIEGILAGLDPHSSYLDKEELALLRQTTNGEFSGLGIEVTMENGLVTIISPIDNSPAEKAGIKSGDMILAVDGKPLTSISLMHAIKKLRGKKGTTVILTVLNKKDNKPRTIKIKRAMIPIQSVKSRLLTPDFGYIRVSQFQMNTLKKTKKAISNLKRKSKGHFQGLILDLRNNPGGLLDSAVEIADLFLDSKKLGKNKLIVYTEGRDEKANEAIDATPGDILHGMPIVVLINHGSASASEIIAGALQDHKRALIVGNRSFGKGSIQSIVPLDKDTALKLTIALYYTPNGHVIQAKGINPDIQIKELQLKPNQNINLLFPRISEKSLEGHLIANGHKHTPLLKKNEGSKLLAKKDFQLYEALQILKSAHILKNRHATLRK